MIRIRRADERGRADHGWLDTYHTFSFGSYQDERHMGFRALRVLNEDRVQPGRGFGTHGHRDMEILSYVLAGRLAHRDSAGHEGVLVPGDVQYMSAGSGVQHSEHNGSDTEPVHFLQIWILPARPGGAPRYAHAHVAEADRRGRLALVAAPHGETAPIALGQDARVLVGSPAGGTLRYDLRPGRGAWVQVARGSLSLDGHDLAAGDGAAVTGEPALAIAGGADAEVLVFDLA